MVKFDKKTIGILGGMGPEATADLYMKIVRYYQKNFNAKYDRDFPPFIIFSIPIPDVVESLENESMILDMLKNASKKLEENKCDFIVIACNTVQYLLDDIRKSIKIPVLGIAEVNAKYIKNKFKRVGILGTKATIEKGVYQISFQEIGIEIIKPDENDQKNITEVIMNILAGKPTEKEICKLSGAINNLKKMGAEAILIACTELPLILRQKDFDIPLIDCTQVYADEAARLSYF
jgi:aspartate racemase